MILFILHNKNNYHLSSNFHKNIGWNNFKALVENDKVELNDIDLIAEVDRPISLLELVGAQIYLSEILQKKVDLVAKDDLREELKEEILSKTMYLWTVISFPT